MITLTFGVSGISVSLYRFFRIAITLIVLERATGVVAARQQPDEGDAPLAGALGAAMRMINTELNNAGAGKAATNGVTAAVAGDVMKIRRTREKLNIDDRARLAMTVWEVLGDPVRDTVEPYTRVKYTFSVDGSSGAMVAIPDNRPTNKLIEKLKLELLFQPDAAGLTGHAIHYGLAIQLLRTAAAKNGAVALADDVLFSRGVDPYMSKYEKRSVLGPQFAKEGTLLGAWTLLSYNDEVSDKYNHAPYSTFLSILLAQAQSTPLFTGGLWKDLLPYAEELTPGSLKTWAPIYVRIAEGFEIKRRYTSGAFIRITAAGQNADDCYGILLAALKSIPADDRVANRNIAIAYGYLIEAQVHFGQNVAADLPSHRGITTVLASRLNEREMACVLATRTAPKGSEK